MQLTIFWAAVTGRQLGSLSALEEVLRREFCAVFALSPGEIAISYGNAHTSQCDLIVAYDAIPNHVINAATKMQSMEARLSCALYPVMASCAYQGRVWVRDRVSLESMSKRAAEKSTSEQFEEEYQTIAKQFEPQDPKFTFERLVLDAETREQILEAIAILENRDLLFRQWGLGTIMSPAVLLNLYGNSGTGKTMAAEAIAHRMGKRIIRASYADIESKYHGEGPKRLKGLFWAAKESGAVLFIDEADSMLSARLRSVSQGSEQAINSMRSQLLMSMENHDGIVIFATNLIENYDQAFLTRLICIEMKRPNREARQQIWRNHLCPAEDGVASVHIPLASDVNLERLADYDFCGRDIRNAVKRACIMTVLRKQPQVTQAVLDEACRKTRSELDAIDRARNGQFHVATGSKREALHQSLSGYHEKA